MVLICISLMINGEEHPFLFLLAICISFSVKCLFKHFAHLKKLIMFKLSIESSLNIMDTSPLSSIQLANIFSQPVDWLSFILLKVSFEEQKFLIVIKSYLYQSFLLWIVFSIVLRNFCQPKVTKIFFCVFFQKFNNFRLYI